jgi:hypothetical protein
MHICSQPLYTRTIVLVVIRHITNHQSEQSSICNLQCGLGDVVTYELPADPVHLPSWGLMGPRDIAKHSGKWAFTERRRSD